MNHDCKNMRHHHAEQPQLRVRQDDRWRMRSYMLLSRLGLASRNKPQKHCSSGLCGDVVPLFLRARHFQSAWHSMECSNGQKEGDDSQQGPAFDEPLLRLCCASFAEPDLAEGLTLMYVPMLRGPSETVGQMRHCLAWNRQ